MSRRDRNGNDTGQSGFTLVEFSMALVLLVTGLLGFVAALISSQTLTRASREMVIAHSALNSTIETFRDACVADFDAAVTGYSYQTNVNLDLLRGIGSGENMITRIIVDETRVQPPIDLNGDGDYNDTTVPLADLVAAVLRVQVVWSGVSGRRDVEYTSIVSRGEFQ